MKVFGFILHPCYKTMINLNWEDQHSKFTKTLFSWSSRVLESLFERAEVVRTFALSGIWYRAQVLPLPSSWASKFESAISNFLWKGCQFNNLLAMDSVCTMPGTSCGGTWAAVFTCKMWCSSTQTNDPYANFPEELLWSSVILDQSCFRYTWFSALYSFQIWKQ